MNKTLLAVLLAASLTACTVTAQSVEEKIKEVQSYTATACKFLPLASTVAALFDQDAGASVRNIGAAICTAITTVPLADGPGDHRPRVGKVVIKGKYL